MTFYGVSIEDECLMTIFEYVENGDLNNYLVIQLYIAFIENGFKEAAKYTLPSSLCTDISTRYYSTKQQVKLISLHNVQSYGYNCPLFAFPK